MADKRITQLELLTDPKGPDAFAIVDVSVPETKQVTYGQLTASIQSDLVDVSTGSLLITSSLDDHTMTFTKGDGSTYFHILPGGSGSSAENHYLVPELITITGSAVPYAEYNLTGSELENTAMIKINWSGVNGTANVILPDATTGTNTYRALRLTMGEDFSSNTKAELQAKSGQRLDGKLPTDPGGSYTLDKAFEGLMVWSDGSNWIRIQTKA